MPFTASTNIVESSATTVPLNSPTNSVAVTVPVTSNSVDGVLLKIPILFSLVSIFIAFTLELPSDNLIAKSKFCLSISITDKSLSTFAVRYIASLAPTLKPVVPFTNNPDSIR